MYVCKSLFGIIFYGAYYYIIDASMYVGYVFKFFLNYYNTF